MEHGRFYKRLESSNEGVDYENLIIADFVLKLTTSSVTNFELSSNDDNFGNLDDIVIEIEENNIKTLYGFQLKYRRSKVLTQNALTAETGKCSITTYFKTFKELYSKQIKCVLFTNSHFYANETITLKIEDNDINVKIKKEESFFNGGLCYSFECEDIKSAPHLFPEFLQNFLLFTNQRDIEKTKNHINLRFQQIFEATNCEYEKYIHFIADWSNLKGKKHTLNKELMQNVISLILLAPQIKPFSFNNDNVNPKEKLLVDAIANFTITEVDESVYEEIKSLYSVHNEDFSNIRRSYQYLLEQDADNLSDLDLSKLLWLKNKTPLIVSENTTAYKVIRLCNTKKFIILKSNFTSSEKIKAFKRLWDVNKNDKIYQDIIETFSCSLQGKKEITLKELIEIDENIKLLITTTELVKMLKGPLKIGKDKEKIANHYIKRRISQNLIDMKYLKNINIDTLIMIDSTTNCQDDTIDADANKLNKIKSQLGNFNIIRTSKFLKEQFVNQKRSSWKTRPVYYTTPDLKKFVSGPDLYSCLGVCTFGNFEKIFRKNPEKIGHQFRFLDSRTLEWIRSKGSVMDLEVFRKKESKFVQDSEFFQVVPENNINLISSDPGMGKSEFLKTLKNNAPLDIWTVYFESSEISTICAFLKKWKFKTLMDYLLEQKYAKFSTFEKAIIRSFYKRGKIAIFWDALDEISTQNIEVVVELIKDLFFDTSYQWVTARCHLMKYLERKLNVLSRKLDQFNEDEQRIYIQYRLETLYSPQIITEIFKMISSTVTLLKHNDVLGVPLQIFMLTELFRQDHEKYLQLLQRVFSLTDLYQHIIDQKFDHYYREKAAVKSPNDALKQVLDAHKAAMFEKYQKAGLKALIKKEVFKELNINCDNFLKDIKNSSDYIGLITEVTDDFPKFLHNSYAEFFVAKYFLDHQKEIKNFDNVIFDKRHANVRFFFDLLSAKDSDAHKAVLYNNVDLLKNQKCFTCDDEKGRNVLELACTWGQKFPKLPITQQENIIIIDNELDVTPETENSDYKCILQFLLKQSSFEDLKTSLKYANKADCLLPKLMIMSNCHQNFIHLKNDEEGVTLLYYSIKLGYDKVVDFFEELPLVKTKTDNSTLLHLAVIYNQEFFLRKLLSTNVYKKHINDKNQSGATPLFKACENGFFQLCVILIENGASVDAPTDDGSTPLHTASLHNHQHIVQFLLKRHIKIDAVKDFKVTPLHAACWNGNFEVAKLLLEAGANPNAVAQDSCTPLYVASRNNHFKVVELLLENQNVNINFAQKDGATPLFIASQEGHEKNVELLLGKGAQIELYTKTGESPLFVAAQNGRCGIVKKLIDAGADVNHKVGQDGWTALEIAIQEGHLEVVKFLVEVKADFGCSKEQITDFAMHHGQSVIASYLKSLP